MLKFLIEWEHVFDLLSISLSFSTLIETTLMQPKSELDEEWDTILF